jgi:hypothetical protein
MVSFDSLEVVESYRIEAEMEEFVEIARALDILGPGKRLFEYEPVLYMKLKEIRMNWREDVEGGYQEAFSM